MFVSRVSLAGAIVLAACTKPNPAFDASRDDASASGSGSTTGTTEPPPDSSTTGTSGSTSGGDSSSSSSTLTGVLPTTSDTSSTGATTSPACGLPDEPCGVDDCCVGCGVCTAGACVKDDAACGPCSTCGGDGQCVPMPPQTPCSLPADPCLGKVWGLTADGACLANGAATGSCDDGGQCVASDCPQGAPIVTCDVSCIVDPNECAGGIDVVDVDPTLLCAQNGPTDACKSECVIAEPQDIAQIKSCVAGTCIANQDVLCGLYACMGDSCNMACDGAEDCKGVQCVNQVCS